MRTINLFVFLVIILFHSCTTSTDTKEQRTIIPLKEGWKFIQKDFPQAQNKNIALKEWQSVTVPHDWAITGKFDSAIDAQITRVIEDGEKVKRKQTGRTAGLPHVGVGWYRKKVYIPENYKDKRIVIEFDGAMSHAQVFINEKQVGEHVYGYSSFYFDITDALTPADSNLIAVRLENFADASRWYPGAGLYRNVRLIIKNPISIAHWGTFIYSKTVEKEKAQVIIKTEIENNIQDTEKKLTLKTLILSPDGKEIAQTENNTTIKSKTEVIQTVEIQNPELWDIKSPDLYKARSFLYQNGQLIDTYETTFGIRTLKFDANTGFYLNGKNVKMKGVCLHHDLGPLGAAVNYRAIEKRLKEMKRMGANAIRTAHNPPTPEMLELCDELGLLVIDEAFDEWKIGKVKNGYNQDFDQWAETDLTYMIKRDRNHPSIVLWSIGNEIREQSDANGAEVAKFLVDICHRLDPTRLTTAGFNLSDNAIKNGLCDAVDVVGWNYKPFWYNRYKKEHPDWIMYGSETSSTTSSRGEYFLPAVPEIDGKRPNLQISSYDMTKTSWANYVDHEFAMQDDCPFILGEFVWTGYDYLGEPTPYKLEWPSRSSYFGIIDLCGIPKDRYWLYKSKWSSEDVLHILPHWNWEGHEGKPIPVHCYTSFDSVELFVNEKSYGIKTKSPDSLFTRYRIIWDDVIYEPGELRAVVYGKPKDKIIAEKIIRTAGKPAKLILVPDQNKLKANNEDLSYITVLVVDKDGNLCPKDSSLIHFDVKGAGEIAAVGNGDATSLEPFKASYRKAFNGKCMLIVKSRKKAGTITINAKSGDLKSNEIVLQVKK